MRFFTVPGEVSILIVLAGFVTQIFFVFISAAINTVALSNDVLRIKHSQVVYRAIDAGLKDSDSVCILISTFSLRAQSRTTFLTVDVGEVLCK